MFPLRLIFLVVLSCIVLFSPLSAQTIIRERVEIHPREEAILLPPSLSEEDSSPTLLRQLSPNNVGFTRPQVQVAITSVDINIPLTPSRAGMRVTIAGAISGGSDLKQVFECDSSYTTTNYQTLPYSITGSDCNSYFYVYYRTMRPNGFAGCGTYNNPVKNALAEVNGSEVVFTIQDSIWMGNHWLQVSATVTGTATSVPGYELDSVTSVPNKTTLQCNDTTQVNINAYNGSGQPLTVCGGETLPATASLVGAGEYAYLRKDSLEGQSISFMMNSASSSFEVVLDTALGVIPYGYFQDTLRVNIDGVIKDTLITFTCDYPQPTVSITYPGQDTTIIVTPEHQPTLNLLEIHSPSSGQFEPQISWEPSGPGFNTADYYEQIDDSLVITVIATATNVAQFEAKDSVKITLKKNPIDHFVLTFEKDTVAYGEPSRIYVQAKDSGGVDVDPPSGTEVNMFLTETEEYGYLSYNDSLSLIFQDVPYEDANAGNVFFTATNQDPGFGTAIVPVGVSKVGEESVNGVDTVLVSRRIKIELLVGAQTLKPLGDADNKKVITGNDTSWVINFAKVKPTTVTVQATDNLQQPVEGYPFTIQALVGALSGGHDHSAGRPTGAFISGSDTVISVQDTTDSNGTKQYTYLSSGFGGIDSLFVQGFTSSDTASKTIAMKIGTFTELTEGTHYNLVGSYGEPGVTSQHINNHYGTSNLVNKLKALADSVYADSSYVLRINDMSLKNGGPFDILNNWNTPHQTHRNGVSADIDDVDDNEKPVPVKYLREWLLRPSLKGTLGDEGNHYHITFR